MDDFGVPPFLRKPPYISSYLWIYIYIIIIIIIIINYFSKTGDDLKIVIFETGFIKKWTPI